MARGWMLLLVGFGTWLAAGAAPHQAAGQSLSQRLGFSDPPRASQQQVMRDPQVRPAAVAAREQSMNATKRRGGGASGGSFLSRFKLPSLLPGGSHDSEALS
ncbi:MAG TPA: hypothetical protein VEQ85_11690, partial [Lacipirellulaceae bacterium]|nr:hypothetical protein [Lacipirellulaceae bacterium]